MTKNRVILVASMDSDTPDHMPLGLLTIATRLANDFGIQSEIIDLPLGEDPDFQDIQTAIRKNEDAVLFVGFSTMCDSFPRTLSAAQSIKSAFSAIPIVLGGPQASVFARDIIENYHFIDCVVLGEAEAILAHLIEALHEGLSVDVDGILFSNSEKNRRGSYARLVDIDSIELPDYSKYPRALYSKALPIEVGRGCPYACTFCATNDFFKRRFRLKSASLIIDQMTHLHEKHGVTQFEFIHDMFTTNKKLTIEVCDALISSPVQFLWGCSSRIDRIDEDLLLRMYQAGCREIYFGIETGSQRLQSVVQKKLIVKDVIPKIRMALGAGIAVTTSLIIGFPQEDYCDLLDTIQLLTEIRAIDDDRLRIAQIHLLSPLSDTPLTKEYMGNLAYDGFKTDITAIEQLTEWEERQIETLPHLFSAYYFVANPRISRAVYRTLYIVFLYGERFREFHLIAHRVLGEKYARLLLEYISARADRLITLDSAFDARTVIPIVGKFMKEFAQHLVPATDHCKHALLSDAIKFAEWRADVLLNDSNKVFYSQFRYDCKARIFDDSAASPAYLYTCNPKEGRIQRLGLSPHMAEILTDAEPVIT